MGKKLCLILTLCFMSVGMAFAQTNVTGKVIESDTGDPVVGAAVLVVGTQTGVQTDLNGNFSLKNVPSSAKLRVSYLGLKETEVAVKPNLLIRMESTDAALDEVLVVAYGSQKKAAFTGAASTVKGESLENLNISNVSKALEGSVAGVYTASASGQPGSESSIRIRGIGSISASQEPLIVLDGVPYTGALSSIPTQDIESLTILKDAAANSMYGSRGANGVIMVTTKSGRSGKARVDFSAKLGWNAKGVPFYDIVTDAGEYYELAYEAIRNQLAINGGQGYAYANQYVAENLISKYLKYNKFAGVADNQLIDPLTGKLNPNAKTYKWGDDWLKEPFSNGLRQEYTANVSAGNDITKVYASLGYLGDKGYVKNSDFKRYNGKIKLDQMIGQYIKVGGSVAYTRTESDAQRNEGTNRYGNLFYFAQGLAPIYPIYLYHEDGTPWLDENGKQKYDFGREYLRPYSSEANPYATTAEDIYNVTRDYITTRGYFEANFLKDFKFLANIGYDTRNIWTTDFMTPMGGDALTVGGRGYKTNTRTASLDAQQLLEWNHTYGDHALHFQLGHENQKDDVKYLTGSMAGFVDWSNPEFANANNYQGLNSYTYETTRDAYFLRGDYNYLDRYYFNASIRRDGSSIFSKDNRWGTFWAVGASWRLKEEPWLKNVNWVSKAKLKVSYGTQGNDNIGLIHAYVDQYDVVRSDAGAGFSKSLRGNPDLTWEKSKNFNLGFEAGFWNRLDIEFDFFIKKTDDLLYQSPLARSEGTPNYIWRNEMDMKNTGIELTINGDIIKNKDLRWWAQLNFMHYKNKLTRLPASKPKELYPDGYQAGSYWRRIGGSLYDFFLYEYAGVDPQTGAPRYNKYADHYYDLEGNRISAADAQALGEGNYKLVEDEWDSYVNKTSDTKQRRTNKSAIPDLIGGFSTGLEWKGFDLSIATAFQLGGYVMDDQYSALLSVQSLGQGYHKDLFNRWTPAHTDTNIPILITESQEAGIDGTSDYFLTKASYFSLKNITLGYTLPKYITTKWGIDNLRVFFSGDNIWLRSKRKGLDPRQSFSGGTSYGIYSALSSYSFGINLSF